MTAFDQAWNLVKMPIVPGSVRRNYRAEEEGERRRRFLGEFDDPQTQERLIMDAIMDPGRLSIEIQDQEDDTYNLAPRSRAAFIEGNWDEDSTPTEYRASGVNTFDDYQRRGYATALYDMASYILDRRDVGNKVKLTPSLDQSSDGQKFWSGSGMYDDMEEYDEEPRWRLRGDLG
jgi:hypothetical protein